MIRGWQVTPPPGAKGLPEVSRSPPRPRWGSGLAGCVSVGPSAPLWCGLVWLGCSCAPAPPVVWSGGLWMLLLCLWCGSTLWEVLLRCFGEIRHI